MVRSRFTAQGFTLVELMGVVAIIGILSVLAVVSYRKILNSSHTSEATQMVGSIKVAQEAYHAEVGTYLNISAAGGGSDYCPILPTGPSKTGWDATCGTGADKPWSKLPVNSNGPVMFGYATWAGLAGATITWPSMATQPSATTPTSDWYVVAAKGDTDGNGVYCTVVGDSLAREIIVDQDTE